eukprot:3110537-Karenia_brevis.AAC.1
MLSSNAKLEKEAGVSKFVNITKGSKPRDTGVGATERVERSRCQHEFQQLHILDGSNPAGDQFKILSV